MWLLALLAVSTLTTLSHSLPQATKIKENNVASLDYSYSEDALQDEDYTVPYIECPEPFGLYADAEQCDAYYECFEGVATLKLCEDGLVFDESLSSKRTEVCDEIYNVECGDRTLYQEPKGTGDCIRKNGKFAIENVCNRFILCINDSPVIRDCPGGLHFDEYTGGCTWPAQANRTDCKAPSKIKLDDGWSCPDEINTVLESGQAVAHHVYANEKDCGKFYICLNGKTPRHGGCNLGEVFNNDKKTCDFPENVPECYRYFDEEAPIKERGNL